MAMHMSGMSNQGMMNLTPLQQQQLLQQQQQQQQQPTNPQQMVQHPQPVVNQQQVAANPNTLLNPAVAPQNPPAEQQKVDHIAKVKTLIWPLKESLVTSIKTAAQNFNQNGMIDFGTMKGTETTVPRFDKQLEEFYSICDQIELNLQAAIGCASQVSSSQRHIPSQVSVRQEAVMNQDIISYPNYVGVAKTQVSYVKDVIDTLNDAAQNLSND